MFLKWISFKLIPLVFLNKSSKLCFFFISENCVLHWFMYGVLTISVYKITLLACVLVTLMSCQETSIFSLLLQVCAADGLPSVCIHKILTGPINVYFSAMLYLPKNPQLPTQTLKIINILLFFWKWIFLEIIVCFWELKITVWLGL